MHYDCLIVGNNDFPKKARTHFDHVNDPSSKVVALLLAVRSSLSLLLAATYLSYTQLT